MDLFTELGASFGQAGQQHVDDPALGLFAVAAPSNADPEGGVAARMALESVRTHVGLNADVLQQFAQHPSDELRARILATLDEAFIRAAQEVFGLARRHSGVSVDLDAVILAAGEAFVAHVGRGRISLWRQGMEHQLTSGQRIDGEAALPAAVVPPPMGATPLGQEAHPTVEILCIEARGADKFQLCGTATDPGGEFAVRLGIGASESPQDGARLALLKPIPLFAHCTEQELRTLARAATPHRFAEGAVIVEQGSAGTELFLVIEGSVEIVRDGRVIARLEPGSHFGEMALLDEPHRSATAVALSDVELLVLDRVAFFTLLQQDGALAVKVLWNLSLGLSSALRQTSATLAAHVAAAANTAIDAPQSSNE